MMGTVHFGSAVLAELEPRGVPSGAVPGTLACPYTSPGGAVEA